MWNLLRLPEQAAFEEAAMLEPMSVAVHAMRRVHPAAGDVAVISGFGALGGAVHWPVVADVFKRGWNREASGSREKGFPEAAGIADGNSGGGLLRCPSGRRTGMAAGEDRPLRSRCVFRMCRQQSERRTGG